MIQLKINDDFIPIQCEQDKWFITHKYTGFNTLEFEVAKTFSEAGYLQEEALVRAENNEYVIKQIDERSDFITVIAELNLDDWKGKVIENARWTNSNVVDVMEAVKPSGWTATYNSVSTKRLTIEYQEGEAFPAVTPFELLDYIMDAWGCVYEFDTINKSVKLLDPKNFTSSGAYYTDELNLSASPDFSGDSTNYITRLYCYGKVDDETGERFTFASINGGKNYVEDFTYSNKVICGVWSDERYYNAENFLADAKKKLAELSMPVRNYDLNVINFDDGIWLYKVVTLIIRYKGIKVDHQVIEWKEYPQRHDLDTVSLSAVAPSISDTFKQTVDSMHDDMDRSNFAMDKYVKDRFQFATDLITGNLGGFFKWIYDDDGRLLELVNLGDTEDIDTAQKVWRWNASGLGHSNNGYNGTYDLALLRDGTINASMITTGVLNSTIIRAGYLQDLKGLNYWNMETGVFRLTSAATVDGTTIKDRDTNRDNKWDKELNDGLDDAKFFAETTAQSVVDAFDAALDQEEVFNRLTNNGNAKGIYMTDDGNLYVNATYIQSGTIKADLIKVGILADVNKVNYWDMRTGEFRLASTVLFDGKTLSDREAAVKKDANSYTDTKSMSVAQALNEALDQDEIFNRLTNHGEVQGVMMSGGQLYINATYINTGILNANLLRTGIIADKAGTGSNSWNLNTGEFSLKSTNLKVDGQKIENYVADNSRDTYASADFKDVFNKWSDNGKVLGIVMVKTADGKYQLQINASYIQTGALNADLMTVGKIVDASGKNYWDLDRGVFSMTSSNAFVGGQNFDSYLNSKDTYKNATYLDVFNKWTDNGNVQGITLTKEAGLQINASYIKTGILDANLLTAGKIKDKKNNNFWDLDQGIFSFNAGNAMVGDMSFGDYLESQDSYANADYLDVFKKWTNNGAVKGITLTKQAGLQINADYIKTGALNADLITAGTIDADLIRTGLITDKQGKNSWNLDTSVFKLASGTVFDFGSSTVTFGQLNTKADNAASAASSAKSTATSAQSTATSAQSTANSAKSTADSLDKWKSEHFLFDSTGFTVYNTSNTYKTKLTSGKFLIQKGSDSIASISATSSTYGSTLAIQGEGSLDGSTFKISTGGAQIYGNSSGIDISSARNSFQVNSRYQVAGEWYPTGGYSSFTNTVGTLPGTVYGVELHFAFIYSSHEVWKSVIARFPADYSSMEVMLDAQYANCYAYEAVTVTRASQKLTITRNPGGRVYTNESSGATSVNNNVTNQFFINTVGFIG